MSSCCDKPIDSTPAHGRERTLTVALAGNPNSGKTTVFNALTGLRQKVANYPGVTVEKKTGRCKLADGQWIDVIDLPGTYSLISRSPDEHVAMEVLRGLRPDTRAPDVVVVVVDASNLQRNLYLVSQLVELGRPMVVALNMMDVAGRRGMRVSPEVLRKELGVPVIPIVGHKKHGLQFVKDAILKATVAPLPKWDLPQAVRDELLHVGGGLAVLDGADPRAHGAISVGATPASPAIARTTSATTGDAGVAPTSVADPSAQARATRASPLQDGQTAASRAWICGDDFDRHIDRYTAIAERLLIGDRAADMAALAGRQPVASLLNAALTRLHGLGIDPMQADIEAHYHWIESLAQKAVTYHEGPIQAAGGVGTETITPADVNVLPYESKRKTLTDKVDAILIHKVWGLLIFAAIMTGLFVSIFWAAAPIMEAIKDGVKMLGAFTTSYMNEGPLRALISDGIFAGVGSVVVFVPQIAMLFLFLAILEDSGYLARAAFLMDRLLSKVGLHGKSFIPLLSSFACAIPGIMATRTIENRRDRLATILIAPFMSCSARLPVYTLLISAFFSAEVMGISKTKAVFLGAAIMLACYALGILAAAGTAFVFKRSFTKGPAASFILELPTYKVPQVTQILRQVWQNTKAFLTKAGTTIFCLSVVLWAMSYYPRLPEDHRLAVENTVRSDPLLRNHLVHQVPSDVPPESHIWIEAENNAVDHAVAAAQSEYSISGRLGHLLEPAIRPLGFDWKMGVGLVSAFAAREVFVSAMGIIYSVGDVENDTQSLSDAMRADHYSGGPRAGQAVWTPLVAVSLLVWFVLAMQCMSTVAIVRRETGGWSWPIFMILYMNALAYVASLTVFQVGRLFVGA